ncbi:MAG: FtsX-like permease family protein [Rikenellaceae bacterium]
MKTNNVEIFIANRLSKENLKGKNRVMINVATISIAISVAVMIVAISVIVGFKEHITSKITGFNSHITLTKLDVNKSYSSNPISKKQPFIDEIAQIEGITSINGYTLKAGVIENADMMEGIVLKGVNSDFDTTFLAEYMVEGSTMKLNGEKQEKTIVISSTLANLLDFKVGDKARMMFIEEPPRRDVFTISGIYNTSFSEVDKIMIFTDIRNVNRLYNWSSDSLTGFEIKIDNMKNLALIKEQIEAAIYTRDDVNDLIKVVDITETNGAMFDWLSIQDLNVVIISIIMLFVAGFNMISMMLILLLDKRAMIGVLKTLGAKDKTIQRIFILRSLYITIKGVLWGVIIGVLICLAQLHFGIVKLTETAYFMKEVPIIINPLYVFGVAVCSVLAVLLIQIIPTFIVSKISPDQNVNYR